MRSSLPPPGSVSPAAIAANRERLGVLSRNLRSPVVRTFLKRQISRFDPAAAAFNPQYSERKRLNLMTYTIVNPQSWDPIQSHTYHAFRISWYDASRTGPIVDALRSCLVPSRVEENQATVFEWFRNRERALYLLALIDVQCRLLSGQPFRSTSAEGVPPFVIETYGYLNEKHQYRDDWYFVWNLDYGVGGSYDDFGGPAASVLPPIEAEAPTQQILYEPEALYARLCACIERATIAVNRLLKSGALRPDIAALLRRRLRVTKPARAPLSSSAMRGAGGGVGGSGDGDERQICVACLVSVATFTIQPCGHTVMCAPCLLRMLSSECGDRCPICRSQIEQSPPKSSESQLCDL